MIKMRLELTKDEAIRYISHLDYAQAVMRAVRRAKLPAAYSEGFNPHMKLSFASALAVGVTSGAEYADLELKEALPPRAVCEALRRHLPPGLRLTRAAAAGKGQALMALINLAVYRVVVPRPAEFAAAVASFNEAETLPYARLAPKGRKELDVKQYIDGPLAARAAVEELTLDFAVRITPGGSVKPSEALTVLADVCGLGICVAAARIHRAGLYVQNGARRRTPLEIDCGEAVS